MDPFSEYFWEWKHTFFWWGFPCSFPFIFLIFPLLLRVSPALLMDDIDSVEPPTMIRRPFHLNKVAKSLRLYVLCPHEWVMENGSVALPIKQQRSLM